MNRSEALERFVGENWRELCDSQATKSRVKLLRQEFSNKHSLAPGERFTHKEAAIRVVRGIAHARRTHELDDVVLVITKLPWIVDELGPDRIRQEIEFQRLGDRPVLDAEDLRHLRQEEYLSSVEEKIAEKVRAEATRQLADEHARLAKTLDVLRVKEEDLKSKESILDSLPPEQALARQSEADQAPEASTAAAIWWEDIGLSSDPFLTNRGVYHIPTDKFESIVVHTPFISELTERVSSATSSFFSQTVLILGRYGSGKSTLFDILERRASPRGVIPLVVTLSPTPSTPGLLESFFSQIGERLGEAFPDTFGGLPVRPQEAADETSACIRAMQSAIDAHPTTTGFYIFIDGLHRPDTYRPQTFEFIQYLQTFEERLERGRVHCGFFIAGLPDWRRHLAGDSALSGSITETKTIPELEVENAVEAVVRRITSYAQPGTAPPQIVRLPLRRGFEVLQQRLGTAPNFREYLDDVKSRLVARDYESVGISITLHLETIQSVKSAFEQSSLSAAYQRLIDPSQHSEAFRRAVRTILPTMASQEGIPEASTVFVRNIGAFYTLYREGFIVKRWDRGRGGVVWHIAESLIPILQQLETDEEVLPTEALEALFVDSRAARPAEAASIYGSSLRQLREMANAWRLSWDSIAEFIESAERRVRAISQSIELDPTLPIPVDLVRKSTIDLALAILEAVGEPASSVDSAVGSFEATWCAPEDANEICELIRLPPGAPASLGAGLGILHRHAVALSTLCDLLSDLVSGEVVAPLRGRKVSDVEKRQVHKVRTAFLAQQLQEAVDGMNDVLERKIRDVVFIRLKCLATGNPLELFPADVRRDIERAATRGPRQLRRSGDRNYFYDVSRGAYHRILFQPGLRDVIFPGAISTEEAARLAEATRILFALGSREAHNDRPRFFRDHMPDISQSIAFCVDLIERLNAGIEQLLDPARARLRFQEGAGLETTFVLPGCMSPTHAIDGARSKAIVGALLDRLKRDRIRFPPLETSLVAVDVEAERALMVGLAAVRTGQVTLRLNQSPFYVELSLPAQT